MKKKKKEYNIEQSPFFNPNATIRINLQELSASDSEDVVLARKRYFKQDEYIKLIISDDLDIYTYFKLSDMAKTVLHYILCYCLEYNVATFRLKASDIAHILHIDTSNIFKGIKELIKVNYIARTSTKEMYWIDHNRFYKGNYIIDKYLKQK